MKAIYLWIIEAIKNLYSFIYTEVGTILKVVKDASGKVSHKRVMALVLAMAGLWTIFGANSIYKLIVGLLLVFGAIWLARISATTKT